MDTLTWHFWISLVPQHHGGHDDPNVETRDVYSLRCSVPIGVKNSSDFDLGPPACRGQEWHALPELPRARRGNGGLVAETSYKPRLIFPIADSMDSIWHPLVNSKTKIATEFEWPFITIYIVR